MKKLIVFMSSVVILGSCSSEKTLSEQIKYDWDINYNSSKDDGDDCFKTYQNFRQELLNGYWTAPKPKLISREIKNGCKFLF